MAQATAPPSAELGAQSAYRRNTELSLLLIALIVGAGATVLAALALNQHTASRTAPYIALIVIA
ncbi:MAG: hypothetical protein QOF16_983, partial [Actinomycetota bacterium]|nr:hypothetical protein [Actinomycetota bacterium]